MLDLLRTILRGQRRGDNPRPEREFIRYVYLDVVGFTRKRSVEAQAEIILAINSIVREAVKQIHHKEAIYIPTGDGMCICLLGSDYDSHLLLALYIIKAIEGYNQGVTDNSRRFLLRFGLNENTDNILIDINGRRNVSGMGINLASRIMNFADGNQILVSSTVFSTLDKRESYIESFRAYTAEIKHGENIFLYQYIPKEGTVLKGLNLSPPAYFAPEVKERRRLTIFEAIFICEAFRRRKFFHAHKGARHKEYVFEVIVYIAALYSIDLLGSTDFGRHEKRLLHGENFDKCYHHYNQYDFWTTCEFSALIKRTLHPVSGLFFRDIGAPIYFWPLKEAVDALKADHPEVPDRIGLSLDAIERLLQEYP